MSKAKNVGKCFIGLPSGDLTTRQALAKGLNRDESTVYRWVQKYKRGGLDGLLEVKRAPGAEPTIRGETLERLKQKLSQREGFASYGAIQQWLKQICGLEVPYSTVHRTVRQTLKAKLKVPRPRSTDVDEHQQEAYKKTA